MRNLLILQSKRLPISIFLLIDQSSKGLSLKRTISLIIAMFGHSHPIRNHMTSRQSNFLDKMRQELNLLVELLSQASNLKKEQIETSNQGVQILSGMYYLAWEVSIVYSIWLLNIYWHHSKNSYTFYLLFPKVIWSINN